MATRLQTLAITAILIVSFFCLPATAEATKEIFDAKYGDDLKRVAATKSAADDIALAEELVADARATDGKPALQLLLCEKAYDLAAKHTGGYATAIDAMRLAADASPDNRAPLEKKLIDVFQRRFDRSKGPKRQEAGREFLDELLALAEASEASEDFVAAARLLSRALRVARATKSERRGEIEGAAKRAAALAPIGKRIAQEKGRLKADPKNRSARMKLIWIYLVDLDNPATAAEYVDDSVGEKMSERVRVVADGPPAPTAGDALDVGQWYRGLAKKAGPASREAMLQRARGYYNQFINSLPKTPPRDQPPNPDRAKAIEGLAQVQAELGNLVAAALKTGRWNDLLKLVDIKKHAKGGTWRRDAGGGIRGQAGWAQDHVMLPIAVDGSYQFKVRFTRLSGTDTIALMFPVASAPALLELSAKGGSYSQLYEVKKTRKTPADFENDVEYTLEIKVMARGAGASVSVDLNGERFMRWRGPRGGLKKHAEWKLANPRAFGLGIHGCTVIFHSAELRMASGSRAIYIP